MMSWATEAVVEERIGILQPTFLRLLYVCQLPLSAGRDKMPATLRTHADFSGTVQ
jgi:hypothetical protein